MNVWSKTGILAKPGENWKKRLKQNWCEIVPKPQTEPENSFVLFLKKKKKEAHERTACGSLLLSLLFYDQNYK